MNKLFLMRVAVCFFGEMTFMDRFMIQNLMRCLIIPFQKYGRREDMEFYYFLHTYFCDDVFPWIEMMRTSFPFTSVTIHHREVVMGEQHDGMDPKLFLQDYSLHRVKKKYKILHDLDIVIFTRLDLLFTKSLTGSDIDDIIDKKRHCFLVHDKEPIVAVGDPVAMSLFADRFSHVQESDGKYSFLEMMRVQHNIKIQYMSIVFVRILSDAIVCPEDYDICPYLKDLIASSSTKIRLVKRKSSIK